MLADWIKTQTADEERPDAGTALLALTEILEATPEEGRPALLAELTEEPHPALLEVPLQDQDATGTLARVIDLLSPDPERAELLARRFTHDVASTRLVGSDEPVDLTDPGWGQLIAVCAITEEDLLTRIEHGVHA